VVLAMVFYCLGHFINVCDDESICGLVEGLPDAWVGVEPAVYHCLVADELCLSLPCRVLSHATQN